jgi:hypothetical protein
MKGLPDSAVVGTYKRAKHYAHKNGRGGTVAQGKREEEFLYNALFNLTVFGLGKIVSLTKKN